MYKIIIALDPSGNFYEGKGTTGWTIFDITQDRIISTGYISASDYSTQNDYWQSHLTLLNQLHSKETLVVIEDYFLYNHKKECQVNSRMETPKLIGVLQHWCWEHNLDYIMQTASEVKTRWTDELLVNKGYMTKSSRGYKVNGQPINRHVRDSIRHAIHAYKFKLKKLA